MMLYRIGLGLVSALLIGTGSVAADNLTSTISKISAKDSSYSSYMPSATLDGDTTTYWKAKKSTSTYIIFKLKDSTKLLDVKITWGLPTTYKYIYNIKTSTDSSSWTTVHSQDTSNGVTSFESNSFTSRNVKWIKINGLGQSEFLIVNVLIQHVSQKSRSGELQVQ